MLEAAPISRTDLAFYEAWELFGKGPLTSNFLDQPAYETDVIQRVSQQLNLAGAVVGFRQDDAKNAQDILNAANVADEEIAWRGTYKH